MLNDRIQIVELRLPAQRIADSVSGSNECSRITCTARGFLNVDAQIAHSFNCIDYFPNRGTVTIATIQGEGISAILEMVNAWIWALARSST